MGGIIMVSIVEENRLLYSLAIRDSFERAERDDFRTLFPQVAAKAEPIRTKLKRQKIDKPFEILPQELDPDKVDFGTKLLELGKMYYFGKNRDIDIKKAIFYFHVAHYEGSADNYSEVLYYLAKIYANGHSNVVPINKGRSCWLLSGLIGGRAEKKRFRNELEIKAAILLAKNLLSSESLARTKEDEEYIEDHFSSFDVYPYFEDYSQYPRKERNEAAIELFKIAAISKSPESLFLLAQMYEAGHVVEKSTELAAKYYLEAHKAGHNEGLENSKRLIAQNKEEKEKEAKKEIPATNNAPQPANNSKKHTLVEQERTMPANNKKIKQSAVIEKSADHKTVTIVSNVFNPQIQPQELNYQNMSLAEKKPSRVLPNKNQIPAATVSAASQLEIETSALDEKSKKEIGRWGEHFAYLLLKKHYQTKYPGYQCKDIENGFELSSKTNSIQVVWHNKNKAIGDAEESGKDLTIKKKIDNKLKEKFVEVKATTANHEHTATFTKNEVLQMLTYSNNNNNNNGLSQKYMIIRVYNAGKHAAKAEKIKNPLNRIVERQLEVTSLQLKI